MESYEDSKIFRITPGQLSKYIDSPSANSIDPDASSSTIATIIPSIPAIFKMYVHQIKVSRTTVGYIKKNLLGQIFISLRWNFFDIKDVITSPEKLEHTTTKFDYTVKSEIEVNQQFVDNVNETPVTFKLYACTKDRELFLSESQFFIDDITAIVNMKQQHRVFFTNNEIDPSGEAIGYLDVWYKFTCKQKTLKGLFFVSKIEVERQKTITKLGDALGEKFLVQPDSFENVHVTDSEFDHFADSVWLVLNRNKVLKTTQSDINNELQERVRWLHFEANWKQTLQENAILHGKNPEEVIWRQWREEDTANVRLRTYDDIRPQKYPPYLAITIVDLCFFQGSSLLKKDDISQFYVEYSFLGYEGPKMETPFSVAKVEAEEKVTFNFRKTFPIDIKKDIENCKNLAKLIKNDDVIRFVVISEPVEDFENPIQTCQEIGYAEVPFSELIQLQVNEDSFEYEVIEINNPIAVLGYLTIKVEGILAMRKMALDLMAPKGYKLYV